MNSIFFNNGFSASSGLDIGKKRNSNQDRIIFCPDMGFFSVIDGMGGLLHGGETAEIITEILPGAVREILENNEINKKNDSETALIIKKRIQEISDIIYNTSNKDDFQYGATISCLLLLNDSAIFVNLGDSRAYLLPRNSWILRQIT
ncbi:MAG: protein phosphatase 2C domain-containing protein, partial [Treponema sp.]|nr:protein phosphatase 2C domain-containing protein [Treponema sp.]